MYYNRRETFHEGLEKEQLKKETDIVSVFILLLYNYILCIQPPR